MFIVSLHRDSEMTRYPATLAPLRRHSRENGPLLINPAFDAGIV